jgi:4-hydroxybenzoate polyprenyltransferase
MGNVGTRPDLHMHGLYNLARLARPSHWIKNLVVFAALVFSRHLTDRASVCLAVIAFAAFCLASSGIYALNDIRDRAEDARHPIKRRRPVAGGQVSVGAAAVLGVVLMAAAGAAACTLGPTFLLMIGAYLGIMLAYVFGLKRVAILDVILLAAGFVLRAYAGGVAIDVPVSPWLVLCTLTLALFLGFAKREGERQAMGEAASQTRSVEWDLYDQKSLEHMMTVSAALAVVTYMLYTVSPETIQRVGHGWMFLTVLPVLYGVFRFYRMAIAGRAADPVDMVRRDPAFVVTVAVWLGMVAALLWGMPKGVS